MKNSPTSTPSPHKDNPLVLKSRALLRHMEHDPEALMYLATRALDQLARLEHHYYGTVFRESWNSLNHTEQWH